MLPNGHISCLIIRVLEEKAMGYSTKTDISDTEADDIEDMIDDGWAVD